MDNLTALTPSRRVGQYYDMQKRNAADLDHSLTVANARGGAVEKAARRAYDECNAHDAFNELSRIRILTFRGGQRAIEFLADGNPNWIC